MVPPSPLYQPQLATWASCATRTTLLEKHLLPHELPMGGSMYAQNRTYFLRSKWPRILLPISPTPKSSVSVSSTWRVRRNPRQHCYYFVCYLWPKSRCFLQTDAPIIDGWPSRDVGNRVHTRVPPALFDVLGCLEQGRLHLEPRGFKWTPWIGTKKIHYNVFILFFLFWHFR